MGKSTISMVIFNCYVSSPEGIQASSSMILRNSQFKLHGRPEASATAAAAGAAVRQRHLGRLHLRHAEELAQGPGASDPAEVRKNDVKRKTSGGRKLASEMKLGK